MDKHYDLAIVGGGIAGAALAYFLSPHYSILLLERESALGYHSTGRSAAEFTHRFHSATIGQLTQASYDFFLHPPEHFTDISLLRKRGNLIIANEEKAQRLADVFMEEQKSAPAFASPIERLSVAQAIEKVPFLNPDYVVDAFYDPDCWDIEVENVLQGYIKGAKRNGAEILLNTELHSAIHNDAHWTLETSNGKMSAHTVVNAAGGWVDPIAEMFGVPSLNIIPHRRTAISVKVPDYDVSHMPEVNEVDEDFYFKPDAGQLMVSPADETPVEPHDAWPEDLDIAYAAHYLTECSTLEFEHIAHKWAGLRTFAPDRLPVVGFSSKQPNFFWLAGQGGYGIQTSPALGRMAASLIHSQTIPEDMAQLGLTSDTFSPARFGG